MKHYENILRFKVSERKLYGNQNQRGRTSSFKFVASRNNCIRISASTRIKHTINNLQDQEVKMEQN